MGSRWPPTSWKAGHAVTVCEPVSDAAKALCQRPAKTGREPQGRRPGDDFVIAMVRDDGPPRAISGLFARDWPPSPAWPPARSPSKDSTLTADLDPDAGEEADQGEGFTFMEATWPDSLRGQRKAEAASTRLLFRRGGWRYEARARSAEPDHEGHGPARSLSRPARIGPPCVKLTTNACGRAGEP